MNTSVLSEDQQDIFNAYLDGENIFITGPGGCGKSFLIQNIVKHAKEHDKKICVTALTGCAAVLLDCGAVTLHSWAGIGLAKADDDVIITRISMNKYKKRNWLKTSILIIDEISMMSKRMFELLDAIGKRVRKSSKPFGGIQVIFSGDFYQLPPVGDRNDPDSNRFCFESPLWNETFDSQCILDKSFRQKDQEYIDILNQVRQGVLHRSSYNKLMKRVGVTPPNDVDIKPVILQPTKKSVEQINKHHLQLITTEDHQFKAEVVYEPSIEEKMAVGYKAPTDKAMDNEVNNIRKNSLFDDTLTLKIGCQVMCIANIDIDNDICNGTTGIIVDFIQERPKVKLNNGMTYVFTKKIWASDNIRGLGIKQFPLILAWAVTIHKSQGSTLKSAEIDIGSSVFAEGQTYVALSRVKSLEGLYLKTFNPQRIKTNKKVIEFYKQFYQEETDDE